MERNKIEQQNRTKGGKKNANLYFTPPFLDGLKKVSKAQNVGMSHYIERNLSDKIKDDLKKLDNK
jgi:hypothetical protein